MTDTREDADRRSRSWAEWEAQWERERTRALMEKEYEKICADWRASQH